MIGRDDRCAAPQQAASCYLGQFVKQPDSTKGGPGPIVINGGPIFLQGREDDDPAETLRRIVRFEIDGKLDVSGTEMSLQHGQFDGVNYCNSTAMLDDLTFHWAAVEGEDDLRIGTRIARVDDPTNAQTYRRMEAGTQMVRVPEGDSDT
jgi:hypothetical protein